MAARDSFLFCCHWYAIMSLTGNPFSAYSIAGSNASARLMVPSLSSRTSHPCTVPGTDTEYGPIAGILLRPCDSNSSMLAALGARPLPFSATTSLRLAFQIKAKRSPPTPVDIGSTTFKVAAVATAASTALPPAMRIRRPAMAANGWLVATMPCVACTVDRRELKNIGQLQA